MTVAEESEFIGLEMNGALMTLEEFDAAENWDEDYRYELVNGVLIVSPPPSEQERGPNEHLSFVLRTYAKGHPQGYNFCYTLSEQTIYTLPTRRRADRAVWVGLGRLPNMRRDVPTIAVEFVSRGKRNRIRDYKAKRSEYAKVGIGEYWIIDCFRRHMTVIRNSAGQQTEIIVTESESYTTPLLPGFQLSVAEVLAEADMLQDAQDE